MLIYDPVEPCVVYSENARFKLELANIEGAIMFKCDYLIKSDYETVINVDFRSIMRDDSDVAKEMINRYEIIKINDDRYKLTKFFDEKTHVDCNVNFATKANFTSVFLRYEKQDIIIFNTIKFNDNSAPWKGLVLQWVQVPSG